MKPQEVVGIAAIGSRKMIAGLLVFLSIFMLSTAQAELVNGYDLSGNLTEITNSITHPPLILSQPLNQTVPPGGAAAFSVTLESAKGASYVWYFEDNVITGAVSDTLLITDSREADQGLYHVVVDNGYGMVASTAAKLFVDYDLDGLGYYFEKRFFGDLWPGAEEDTDQDGLTNLEEQEGGTNPANHETGIRVLGAEFSSQSQYKGQADIPSNLSNVVAIASGFNHNLALTSEGYVVGWGDDTYGATNPPPSLSNVVSIAAGAYHSLAIKLDGTVEGWGQAGNINIPDGLSNVVEVAVGTYQNLALKSDGTVVVFGNANWTDPVPEGLNTVVGVAAGHGHNLAVKADGRVVAWGNLNTYGQQDVPPDLTNAVAVAAGYQHSMALNLDGTVSVWGRHQNGQTNVPSHVTNAVAIAAGNYHCLAILADGSVAAWGQGDFGQTSMPDYMRNIIMIDGGSYHSISLSSIWSTDGTPLLSGSGSILGATDSPLYRYLRVLNGMDGIDIEGLPSGIDFDPATGLLSGTPTESGTFQVTLSITNAAGVSQETLELIINSPVPGITSPKEHTIMVGDESTYQMTVESPATGFGASGLPAGLQINTLTGEIIGQPTETGIFEVDISATNSYGANVERLTLQTKTVAAWGAEFTNPAQDKGQADVPVSLSNVVAIAAGYEHSLAVKSDGTVIGWGDGTYGVTNPPPSLSNVVAIAAGQYHNLALNGDGTLEAWGHANYLNIPAGLSNVVEVVTDIHHSLALKSDGTVVAFGLENWIDPVPEGLNIVVGVATGHDHNLAVKADGSVVAWGGNNTYGQQDVPPDLTNAVAVAAGYYHSMALRLDGSVTVWGQHQNGQTNVPSYVTNAVAIAAGDYHCLARLGDGSVVAWGHNLYDQVPAPDYIGNIGAISAGRYHSMTLSVLSSGNGLPFLGGIGRVLGSTDQAFQHYPQVFNGATGFSASGLPAGLFIDSVSGLISGTPTESGSFQVSLSITNEAGVANEQLEVIINSPVPGITSPKEHTIMVGDDSTYQITVESPATGFGASGLPAGLQINTLTGEIIGQPTETGIFEVSISATNSYGVNVERLTLQTKTVAAWGAEFTNPAQDKGQAEVPISLSNVVAIAVGYEHNLALTLDGTVVGWGDGTFGITNAPSGLSNVVSLAAGRYHSLALKADGTVEGWGNSSYLNIPSGLSNVVQIAANVYHSLALRSDGTVEAFGHASYTDPVPIGLNTVVGIAAGNGHNLAVKNDGTVVAWGNNNSSGQQDVPADLTNAVAVAAGNLHSIALRSNGSIVAWGASSHNRIDVPNSATNVIAIAAGDNHSMALRDDGKVVAWGYDFFGQASVPDYIGNIGAISAGYNHSLALAQPLGTNEPPIEISLVDWASSYGLTGPDALPQANTDGDESNLLSEYAFNLNPTINDTVILTPGTGTFGLPYWAFADSGTNMHLQVEYIRRTDDPNLAYQVQFVSDLTTTWSNALGGEIVMPIDSSWERVIVEDSETVSSAPIRFGRVIVIYTLAP